MGRIIMNGHDRQDEYDRRDRITSLSLATLISTCTETQAVLFNQDRLTDHNKNPSTCPPPPADQAFVPMIVSEMKLEKHTEDVNERGDLDLAGPNVEAITEEELSDVKKEDAITDIKAEDAIKKEKAITEGSNNNEGSSDLKRNRGQHWNKFNDWSNELDRLLNKMNADLTCNREEERRAWGKLSNDMGMDWIEDRLVGYKKLKERLDMDSPHPQSKVVHEDQTRGIPVPPSVSELRPPTQGVSETSDDKIPLSV